MRYNIVLIVLLLSACQQSIQFDPPENLEKNVINSVLYADQNIGIEIFKTINIYSADTQNYINDAMVQVFENNSSVAVQLFGQYGKYQMNYRVKPGQCYMINGQTQLGKSIGKCCIPWGNNLISMDTSSFISAGDSLFRVTVKWQDTAALKNFYRFSCKTLNKVIVGDDTQYIWQTSVLNADDLGLFKNGDNFSTTAYLLRDETFNGQIKETGFTFSYRKAESKAFQFIFEEIDQQLFEYYKTSTSQTYYINDPNAQYIYVFSNIENGFGIVGGSYAQPRFFTVF